MDNLKDRAVKGGIWSAIDSFAGQGIQFVVGIILANILSPREFGLIGMITVFVAISQSFIDSGFANALIRKRNCTQSDYSTVFFFNIGVGALVFLLLLFLAPLISNFFNEPELLSIIRVLSLVLIIDSVAIIHRTVLIKQVNFKLQTRISIVASFGAGVLAIILAYRGFGVWSLVFMQIAKQGLNAIFLWFWNRWRPSLTFSITSFKELFAFGSKLLISGLIDVVYKNVYYLIVGKFFSASELGYFTRADQFRNLPSQNLTFVMTRVTFPILAEIQDDRMKLKAGYQKMIKIIMFISMVVMSGLAAVAEPLIITLIGEQWRPSIIYLQLLTFVGMMFPLHALNLNMLQVQGRSDLFLKLEIIKKIIAIPTIVVGFFYGVKIMIIGMCINTVISYYLNSYWSGRFINYSIKEQFKDVLPNIVFALCMGVCVLFIGTILNVSYPLKLVAQIVMGGIFVFVMCEIIKLEAYIELKIIVKEKILQKK